MEIYQTCRGSDSFDIAVLKPQVEQAQEGLKALVGWPGGFAAQTKQPKVG